ncbi:hypothetical protein MW887_012032 [Aspergillus wentii]|nr:hypothetical protein MW887_012032 [Aspergillus wentii]
MSDNDQQPPPPQTSETPADEQHIQPPKQSKPRLQVHTHHCRFCSHLILSTTRTISSLPRRKEPSKDAALILPLPADDDVEDDDEEEEGNGAAGDAKRKQKHYTILLSTTIPDRKPTLVRREDGFEKRLLLRCGRCRVVVGYFLDPIHFPKDVSAGGGDDEDGMGINDKAKVVYILPAALMETEVMDDEEKIRGTDGEWSGWAA